MRRGGAAGGLAACMAALALLPACAATRRAAALDPALLAGRPLVVMLPLANLSGRLESGDLTSRLFYAELAKTRAFELVDWGEAERLVETLRVRDTGAPTPAQLAAILDSTGARYVLAGSVLESGSVRTPEGDVPAVGVSLRLIDAATRRAVWADARFRTGEDDETLFGWGRETSLARVTERLARDMFETFRAAGAAADTTRRGS
uniref:Penicillin-binding protein activator LpoB n=1 Tax=Eiseniibacteriota bacterium TaxID=2212470 RepID=A0A832I2M2_UNCEI